MVSFAFKLPDLGEGIHEAEILAWHRGPGEAIQVDEPLVDVETDKASVVIPCPVAGTVLSLAAEVGQSVRVGATLALLEAESIPKSLQGQAEGESGEDRPELPAPSRGGNAPRQQPPANPPARMPVMAAPRTRRRARELGVEIENVPGSGPAGRVTDADVERFAETAAVGGAGRADEAWSDARKSPGSPSARSEATTPPGIGPVGRALTPSAPSGLLAALSPRAPGDRASTMASPIAVAFFEAEELPDFERQGPVERIPIRSIRRKIARRTVVANLMVPQAAHMDEADITELEAFRVRLRQTAAAERRPGLGLLPFAIRAVVRALKRIPVFNASVDPVREEIVLKKAYHIGVAAATERGLVVPVIENADHKSLREIASEIEGLSERARAGTSTAAELRGGTFTITNIGAIGGTGAVPIVNYPEVAILAMARAEDRPVVRDGQIAIRKILPLVLSFDHRVADGAEAARFLNEVRRLLAEPDTLFTEM